MITGLGVAGAVLMGLMMGSMMLGGWKFGRKHHGKEKPSVTARCPVSGNEVAVSSAAVHAVVGGKAYYFDDEEHLREFVLDPDKYLRREKQP